MNRCFNTTIALITIRLIHHFAVGAHLFNGHRVFPIVRSGLLASSRSIPAVDTRSNLLEILSIFTARLLRDLTLIKAWNAVIFTCLKGGLVLLFNSYSIICKTLLWIEFSVGSHFLGESGAGAKHYIYGCGVCRFLSGRNHILNTTIVNLNEDLWWLVNLILTISCRALVGADVLGRSITLFVRL